MPKFKVSWQETNTYALIIEAESRDEAAELFENHLLDLSVPEPELIEDTPDSLQIEELED